MRVPTSFVTGPHHGECRDSRLLSCVTLEQVTVDPDIVSLPEKNVVHTEVKEAFVVLTVSITYHTGFGPY